MQRERDARPAGWSAGRAAGAASGGSARHAHYTTRGVAMVGQPFIPDADLDPTQRRALAEFLTPRRAVDGTTVWPLEELGVVA